MFEPDPQAEARIRDLEAKMAAMPGSRVFVGLAEEYRRAGRLNEALAVLRQGLTAHPTYLSAQIAIARLFRELGRSGEAIEAFSKALVIDRENLVAAKALADLYWDTGNRVEAIKKFKLYRAISGDRTYDGRISELEREIRVDAAPEIPKTPPTLPTALTAALPASDSVAALIPPPSFGFEELSLEASDFQPRATVEPATPRAPAASTAHPAPEETFDPNATMSISLTQYPAPKTAEAPGIPEPAPEPPVEAKAPEARELAEVLDAPVELTPPPDLEPLLAEPAAQPQPIPPSKTLADLYFDQGFFDDARTIYEKLLQADPADPAVARRLSELKGTPAGASPPKVFSPHGLRSSRAERLQSWLAHVQSKARQAERS
jgi:tetratricopeptide (TPR) repeat protein